MDKRRQEIESKRAKLNELKRARIERKNNLSNEKKVNLDSVNNNNVNNDLNAIGKKEIDDLIASLIGSKNTTNNDNDIPLNDTTNIVKHDESDINKHVHHLNTGPQVELQSVDQEIFQLPPKDIVVYNKEVQTVLSINDDDDDDEDSSGVNTETADELKARMQREEESRIENENMLIEEERAIEKEIELEIEDISEEERMQFYTSPDFGDFVETSSKIIQRALSDNYDVTRDYRVTMESTTTDNESKSSKLLCSFIDDKWTKNRSITAVDWSHIFSELSLAAYNKNTSSFNEPNGIVAIWNMHLADRPEFVLHSQSDVLSATFSPFHANLIFGGSYSGQILLWDTRAKHAPVLKSPLSATGHTHPVYDMQIVGTQNANNLMTTSTDGLVCSWTVDMLAQPQESIELSKSGHNKTDEVAITCFDLPQTETMSFWVGTEEGSIWHSHRHDRAGVKAGIDQNEIYTGHSAPINSLNFHPMFRSTNANSNDFTDLFLTSSIDWTVKLWSIKGGHIHKPLMTFNEYTDCVYDARWHPLHPGVFGSVDGAGEFKLWNLNVDTEVPISTASPSSRAINKLAWDRKDGRKAALGSSDGVLYIYDIGDQALLRSGSVEWDEFQTVINHMNKVN